MKLVDTPLQDLKIVELDVFGDARGFFMERFSAKKFEALGLTTEFLQDNHSRSAPGILRGLHFQLTPPQGKLVGCISGAIWDVAVDIRPDSPTFKQHFGIELTGENGKLLWIPAGFAHGFCVLGDTTPADVYYKCTALYNPEGEHGIAWNDPDLAVNWPLKQIAGDTPAVSERDNNLPSWQEYAGTHNL
jgi:dTDP-4-dehydrorhamnose 3,5-epimerase